ncbi:MAG: ABC-F family ATP-binding cassette domain-containing protein [Candidatus Marinimicrobia bacterium]|nr:ABC-F family ATP-binding cassette domain-containing protein [Candidatus Neomarinimicrobiota bacterium]MBL7109388.1 ABC-F family ATP-binding cassette domain-containing protein [Candidatus Neomarinimicrobiota bacterium]
MLRIESISKSFGEQKLFSNTSLQIKPNMRLGLIGSNGVGKTTLFRIILGEESIDAGNVMHHKNLSFGVVHQEVENFTGKSILSETLSIFPEISKIEDEIVEISNKLNDEPNNSKLLSKLSDYQIQLENIGGYSAENKAKTILSGLGFKESLFYQMVDTLSGGWKMRVALAKVLLLSPDLLLLDEPTNHLDLESLIWLENFLSSYKGSIIVISHDRYFLDRLVTHIAEISRNKIWTFKGNYSKYFNEKEVRNDTLVRQAKNQGKQIAQTERFIERFKAKNTLATRVKSKIKELEKMERIEVPKDDEKTINFSFPQPIRSGLKVVDIKDVNKSYDTVSVYDNFNFQVERGDRLALVGPNGAGKSTLVKLIGAVIEPNSGEVKLGHNVEVNYYAQHQLEALNPSLTVFQTVEGLSNEIGYTQLRSFLGSFQFSGSDIDKKVSVLSGGEKARLALAKMLINPGNLLLLDEPTNHLDIQSQDVLTSALKQFSGTIIFISHDRQFINKICNKVVEIDSGNIQEFEGNYDYYIWKKNQIESKTPIKEDNIDKSKRKENYEEQKAKNRIENKQKRKIKKLETEITNLELSIKEKESEMSNQPISNNYAKLQEIMDEKASLQLKLDAVYVEWLELQ